ncbi:MAG TPA: transaldolase family protein [Terriglobales bacterium]|nr:transaldolase family protein [Terriglobales bacterium]
MSDRFEQELVDLSKSNVAPQQPQLVSSPLLAAVCAAGTKHIYADSADGKEIGALVAAGDGRIYREIDGSTANQPLIRKVFDRYLSELDIKEWSARLRAADPSLSPQLLTATVYAAICGRAGNDVVHSFAAGRDWGVSLQLHMDLAGDAAAAKRIGRALRQMVPSGVVKVPFSPHHPECFLVARDLEREGIPINFTSTFSARQTVAAALLADVTLTNIFMGRINQGLDATMLGEHVDLCAQRELRRLRQEQGVKTLLIVASVREWQTFAHVAGCDVFTSPVSAIKDFMTQTEIPVGEIRSQLETSYKDQMAIGAKALDTLGVEGIARLYEVEPEFVRFLVETRQRSEYAQLQDGEPLVRWFEQAGFGDFFYAPSDSEWQELSKNKLPQLDSTHAQQLELDTLYTLLADADFIKYQAEMDQLLQPHLG